MKIRIALALAALTLVGAACSTPEPDTLGVDSFDNTEETSVDTTATTAVKAAPATCDIAREAFLTGTPADIGAALEGLKADTSADATAREYADYYLGRDAGDPDLQEMDKGIIQMYCSI